MSDKLQDIIGDRRAIDTSDWRQVIVNATKGNQSRLGALIISILKKDYVLAQKGSVPRFDGNATITSDGFVMCDFYGRQGDFHRGAFVGSIGDVVDNFRKLADHCKLNDEDRKAMFLALKNWIAQDYRPVAQREYELR